MNNQVSQEERVFIRTVFNEIRAALETYQNDRAFVMSNAQLFAYLTYSPVALAIASDGTVDEKEMVALEKIVRNINVSSIVNFELMERLSYAIEPERCILNEEFNIRAGAELLYLCRNMPKYEAKFVEALKALLKFDYDPKRDDSMTKRFVKMMDAIIEGNISQNKEEEMRKMKELQQQLGIAN